MCTTLTNEKLEKTHLSKVLSRYTKKGDAKTQHFAKKILNNAATATKAQTAESPTKKLAVKEGNGVPTIVNRAAPESVVGVKRAASTAGEGGPQKRTASGTAKPAATATGAKQNGVVKKLTEGKSTPATTATVTKTKQVTAKPSGFFSSLQSAGKKPGTSNASKAGQPGSTALLSKTASTGQSTAPKSTFSFADTMASLSRPKEEKPTAPKQQERKLPPETPEEKARRLRKESRRHLHVSFKHDDELVEIHEFTHDPDEELGHDSSQMRDLEDRGGEGRMFKQQHQMMEIDEDDEGAEEEEKKLIPFRQPSSVDFSDVDLEERNRNFAPFGGGKQQLDSPERAVREQYEANTLIVFYTDPGDIPPNPREPADPSNGQTTESANAFGAPEAKYLERARRKKIEQGLSFVNQKQEVRANASQRLDFSQLSSFVIEQQYPPPGTQQPAPPPPSAAPAATDALNSLLASLKQAAPSQATPPPPSMAGFGNPHPVAPPPTTAAQQPNIPLSGQPDLAAILAQISQNQPGGAGQAPAPSMGAYGMPPPNTTGYPPQQQQQGIYENPERQQWREHGSGGDNNVLKDKRQSTAKSPYWRTKVCKYWQEGKCQKGDGCSYKHEVE